MTEYHSEESYTIMGRGTAYNITEGLHPEVGSQIMINGTEYTVRGVESCLVPGHKNCCPFGILV